MEKEEKVKPRGIKKGESPTWEVGRKPTGVKRNKRITFNVTEEELVFIRSVLKKNGNNQTDAILGILKKYDK